MSLKVGSLVAEKYLLMKILGEGGFGVVYQAYDQVLNRHVALKLLKLPGDTSKDDIARFVREAAILARLNHDNIIKVFSVDLTESGNPFVVMELLEGRTLLAFLNESQTAIDEYNCIHLFEGICKGIAHAHQIGVIHRDISPANIFLLGEGNSLTAKLIDFGLARIEKQTGTGTSSITIEGSLLGNPQFMSPEACLGKRADRASDIYSLGCVLYNMLTGQAPFQDCDTTVALLYKHMNEYPQEPILNWKDTQKADLMKSICWTCLQKKAEDRPASMNEILDLLDGKNASAEMMGWKSQKSKSRKWILSGKNLVIVAASFVFLTITSIAGFKFIQSRAQENTASKNNSANEEKQDKLKALKRRLEKKLALFSPDSPELAGTYLELANYYYSLDASDENEKECLKYLDKIVLKNTDRTDRKINFRTDIWDVYRMKYDCLIMLKRDSDAEKLIHTVLKEREACSSAADDTCIYWRIRLASLYQKQNKTTLANKIMDEALKLSSNSSAVVRAETNLDAASLSEGAGDNSKAIGYLKQALSIEELHQNSFGSDSARSLYKDTLLKLASVYNNVWNHKEAEKYANIGIKLTSSGYVRMRFLIEQSRAQFGQFRIDEARATSRQALDELKNTRSNQALYNDPFTLQSAARSVWLTGQFKAAIPLLKKAIEICKKHQNRNPDFFKDDLAWCYFNCGAWSNAESLYRQLGPDLYNDGWRFVQKREHLAACCKQLGKTEDSIRFAKQAIELAKKETPPAGVPESKLIMAEQAKKEGQMQLFREYLEQAVKETNASSSTSITTRVALQTSAYYEEVGAHKRACQVLRDALFYVNFYKGDTRALTQALAKCSKS